MALMFHLHQFLSLSWCCEQDWLCRRWASRRYRPWWTRRRSCSDKTPTGATPASKLRQASVGQNTTTFQLQRTFFKREKSTWQPSVKNNFFEVSEVFFTNLMDDFYRKNLQNKPPMYQKNHMGTNWKLQMCQLFQSVVISWGGFWEFFSSYQKFWLLILFFTLFRFNNKMAEMNSRPKFQHPVKNTICIT